MRDEGGQSPPLGTHSNHLRRGTERWVISPPPIAMLGAVGRPVSQRAGDHALVERDFPIV